MSAPKRIQRKRTKGWRMPEGAVYVGRPTLWGNPWRPRDAIYYNVPPELRVDWAVRKYRQETTHLGLFSDYGKSASEMMHPDDVTFADHARRVLGGKDLVCWCPLDQPCHADVLLEIANA